jgi:hypothetical protein
VSFPDPNIYFKDSVSFVDNNVRFWIQVTVFLPGRSAPLKPPGVGAPP